MSIGASRPTYVPEIPGEKERINRVIVRLEQDIARLEKSLADRKSPEGQESTRNAILYKRSQVHRLRSAARTMTTYKPIPRERPMRTEHVQTPVPPKGSVKNKMRSDAARQQLNQTQAPPPPGQSTVVLEKPPPVVDDKSAQKAAQVVEDNKKKIHEEQMRLAAEERRRKEEEERKNQTKHEEKPKPKLTPSEMNILKTHPKSIMMLEKRLQTVNKTMKEIHASYGKRKMLSSYRRFKQRIMKDGRLTPREQMMDNRLRGNFKRQKMDFTISMQAKGVNKKVAYQIPAHQTVRMKDGKRTVVTIPPRRVVMNALEHPDQRILPQRIKSMKTQYLMVKQKADGLITKPTPPPRPKPKEKSALSDAQKNTIKWLEGFRSEWSTNPKFVALVPLLDQLIGEVASGKVEPNPNAAEQSATGKLIGEKMREIHQGMGGTNFGGHPHRPYALPTQLGSPTIVKNRMAKRLNPPSIESNNMKQLRRHTAVHDARARREREESEAVKGSADLAGAFSHTRAVMNRLVR